MHQIKRAGGALGAVAAFTLIGILAGPAVAAGASGADDRGGEETASAHRAEPAGDGRQAQAEHQSQGQPQDHGQSHRQGQGQGQGQGSSGSTWTEDNDTNDGGTPNNRADDGDNAHPSRKDRSVESGGSENQGKAASDPDDDGRGPDRTNEGSEGADQPNGPGGVDKADQDGNNGCGNDDDFEDDNEGWCGKRKSSSGASSTPSNESKAQGEQPAKSKQQRTAPSKRSGSAATSEARTNGKRPSGGNVDGKGTAAITVTAECRSVHVASSKDISNVVVIFADGTSVKFDGLSGREWSQTFDQDVAGASAKSATTRVTGTASCGGLAVDGAVGGTDTAAAGGTCPAGMVSTDGATGSACAVPGTAEVPCPAGAEDMNGDGHAGGCRTIDGAVLGGFAAAADPEKLPARAEILSSAGAELDETVRARSASGAVAAVFSSAVGGVLATTGSNPTPFVAIALGLLAAGVVLVITTRQELDLPSR